ncbi:LysR family transcriptional regulator [Xanthomonas sacchari]|uniref:LysR family transcriptional regulator n=2 Tax=Xanthomonas TaxID=338 RepID=UPI0003A91D1E|nr:LysR substrate-binding domain-containing protein [Xanthomonas sacchari]MCW0423963.1 Hca operon transcriptional activator HcaR [Xanthomonas sacchari]
MDRMPDPWRSTPVELRHLRCFLAVASELHFARAAQRLHIEQSPLSRTIKELEEALGVQLFARTTRSTRLTRAGELFLAHAHRVFAVLGQAHDSVRAAAHGYYGQMRIALSDAIPSAQLAALLALCRQEEPEVDVRLFRVPLAQLLKGLREEQYDVGLAQCGTPGDGVVAEQVWSEPLRVAVPARHPLLAYRRIPLDELLRYPLLMGDARVFEGYAGQVAQVLCTSGQEPLVAETVDSSELMMVLVSAGIALALVGESLIAASHELHVVARPLAGRSPRLHTYLLRPAGEPPEALGRFIERVHAVDAQNGVKVTRHGLPEPPATPS